MRRYILPRKPSAALGHMLQRMCRFLKGGDQPLCRRRADLCKKRRMGGKHLNRLLRDDHTILTLFHVRLPPAQQLA